MAIRIPFTRQRRRAHRGGAPEGAAGAKPRWLVGVTEYAGVTAYTGGIGRHYASLLPALVRAGVHVDLVIFGAADLIARKAPGGVRLIAHRRFAHLPRALEPIVRAIDFRAIAGSAPYSRIFVPEWAGVAAFLPGGAPLVTNLATSMRVSHVVAGLESAELPASRRRLLAVQGFCEERQMRRSRGLVPISSAMLAINERLLGVLPPARVVRNCIDVASVQAGAEAAELPAAWPSEPGPTVLFLGRIERRKGALAAAQAFARLAERFPDLRLVFAGATGDRRFEPTRDELFQAVPEAARGRVVLLGHVAGDSIYRAIAEATVVISPSKWEGFGQVALEAKAVGRPLVVTTGSGFDDFCTDDVDSLMVVPDDVGALASAIDRLLGDPALRSRLGAAARAGIDRFTADAVAPDLIAAVDALVTSPTASRRRRA